MTVHWPSPYTEKMVRYASFLLFQFKIKYKTTKTGFPTRRLCLLLIKKKVASSLSVSLAAAFAIIDSIKHNTSNQGHEKKPHNEGWNFLFKWNWKEMHKWNIYMHIDDQTRLRCCRVVTVAIGTRRCGAPSLNIGDTSPDYLDSPSLLNAPQPGRCGLRWVSPQRQAAWSWYLAPLQ